MTYEFAARILSKYAETINAPDLCIALKMGADALFKRASAEKAVDYGGYAISYSEENPDGELVDISKKESSDELRCD